MFYSVYFFLFRECCIKYIFEDFFCEHFYLFSYYLMSYYYPLYLYQKKKNCVKLSPHTIQGRTCSHYCKFVNMYFYFKWIIFFRPTSCHGWMYITNRFTTNVRWIRCKSVVFVRLHSDTTSVFAGTCTYNCNFKTTTIRLKNCS